MRPLIPDYLADVIAHCADDESGALADYIPELAHANPDRFGVALATVDGAVYCTGDTESVFTIQSISKPFVYALALRDRGFEAVLEKIDVEPSGDAYNELSLEGGTGRPFNPMINAGALATHVLIEPDGDVESRFEVILAGLSAFAGRQLEVDDAVYNSEVRTAFRNRALANMLRSFDGFEIEPVDVVRGYTRQCAVLVTTRDLAIMAATLANGGTSPVTGDQVVSPRIVRQVLSVMATCGMYNSAGDWLSTVGIPAKSGVSGGILGVLPGQSGLATFSPRLDEHGNSVRGVMAFDRFSEQMDLHLMEVAPPARGVIHEEREVLMASGEVADVFSLQGAIRFAGAERVVRTLVEEEPEAAHVVFDFSQVYSVNRVAGVMLREVTRRMVADGHVITVVDPDEILGITPDGESLLWASTLEEALAHDLPIVD